MRGGYVDEARLDEAVTNLMECRMKLGILGDERQEELDKIGYDQVDLASSKALNQTVSRKSLVLLKNEDNFLPLDKSKLHTIGVIGPNADSRKALVGNYEGTASRYITVLEGIEDYVGDDVKVYYSEACDLLEGQNQWTGTGGRPDFRSKSSLRGQRCDYRGDGTGFQHRGRAGGRRQRICKRR